MATTGNLELRLSIYVYYASTTHDGCRVYEAIPKLVEFLDSFKNPTAKQFEEWFRNTSKELIPYNYSKSLIGGCPSELIMDIPRRLILHTGNGESYELVSNDFSTRFENACILLKTKYDFEILNYVQPGMRKLAKSLGTE